MPRQSSDISGKTFGRYQVQMPIGKGGMAEVFKAYDPQLDRFVALKMINLQTGDRSVYIKRFEREAKALARLSHPHIVKIYDYGINDDVPFLVMEYLPGGTLRDQVKACLPYQQAARLLLPIAQALDYAHHNNIIHRDVKPANILFSESGEPLLSDFGIIKLVGGDQTNLTGSGIVIGTSDYMPPEQWTGSASPQSDIYALGVIYFQMLTGKLPYQSSNAPERVIHQILDTLPNVKDYIPDLPPAVEDLIRKTLAKNPLDRYTSADKLAQALDELINDKTSGSEKIIKQPKQKPVKPAPAGQPQKTPAAPARVELPSKPALATGASFGRYRILEPLIRKGSAARIRAQDTLLDRVVILQIFPDTQDISPVLRKQFEEEATLLSTLSHPNITRLVDFGIERGALFLATQYSTSVSLEGQTGNPIPWQEVTGFILPIARALAAAHEKDILHCSLKPANIHICDNGTPILTGFKLPVFANLEPDPGYNPYTAPEQAAGETCDNRSDIYSLAVIFYEMLCGKHPYDAATAPALVYKQMTQALPDLRENLPNLPVKLWEILQKALDKEPDKRYQDIETFISDLEYILEHAPAPASNASDEKKVAEPLHQTPPPASKAKKRRGLRYFLRLFFYTLFLLVVAVIAAYLYTGGYLPLELR